MTSKRLLRSRWQSSSGNNIQENIDSLGLIHPGHGRTSEELYRLLDGLPFKEEVANGRDFRGMNIAARELDLTNCNFAYAHISYFYNCNLDNSIFDSCVGERATFHSSLNFCSFIESKLRSCYFDDSNAQKCDFSNAKIAGCSFQNVDLRGSRFLDADCRGATFAGANLLGCDFRGAILSEAVFCDVQLDKSTNFRDAKMSNVIATDWRDSKGNIIRKGADFNLAAT